MNRTLKRKEKKANLVVEIVVLLASVIILIPIAIMFLGSVKNPTEAASAALSLPTEWAFGNYSFVIAEGGMVRAGLNSLFITGASVALTVVLSSTCGYVLSRRRTKTARRVYFYLFLGLVAPSQIVTTFMLFKMLHFSGFLSIITLYTAYNIPFTVLLYEGFMRTIPTHLEESAVIDGCGPVRAFFSIILPLLQPVTMTSIVTIAIAVWNDFMLPLYMLSSSKYWTLPLTVYNFFGQFSSNWNYVFANLMLTALPMIILYMALQKYIIDGMTAGAVKG